MRAVRLVRHGGPEALELHEVPVPDPGPDDVLVRVGAAGLNNTDVWTREGTYGLPGPPAGWLGPLDLPRIQGADVAGTVTGVGSPAHEHLRGARVLVDPALYADDGPDALPVDILGSERDGGYAEYVVVPAQAVHRMDGSPLSDVELAALPISYGTALGMVERGGVAAGDTVLVTGASGGVGLAAVQVAASRGARVVAISSGRKLDAVRRAGADVVVDRAARRVVQDVLDAAPGGVSVAVDVVAGPLLEQLPDLLAPGGRWVVAGALDGHQVSLDVRALYLRNLRLVGSTMHTRTHFAALAELAREGRLRPVVAQTFSLEDAPQAQATLAERRHVGKLVLAVGAVGFPARAGKP